jgi:hypothetical protein
MSDSSFRNPRGKGKKRNDWQDHETVNFKKDRVESDLEQLAHECRELTVDYLSRESSSATLCEVVGEALDIFSSRCSGYHFDPEPACRKGCYYCCCEQVDVTQAEAAYIGFKLLSSYTESEIKDIMKEVDRTTVEVGNGRTAAVPKTPCVFLKNNICGIYEARPLACRGRNSFDEIDCKLNFKGDGYYDSIQSHQIPMDIAGSIQEGLLRGTKNLGLEAGLLDLRTAVKIMLHIGVAECVDAWLQGDFFFGKSRSL